MRPVQETFEAWYEWLKQVERILKEKLNEL